VPEDLSGDRYSPIVSTSFVRIPLQKGKGQTAEQNSSARQLDPESLENSGGPTARSVAEVWPYGYFSGQSAVIALLLFVVFHLLQCFRCNMILICHHALDRYLSEAVPTYCSEY